MRRPEAGAPAVVLSAHPVPPPAVVLSAHPVPPPAMTPDADRGQRRHHIRGLRLRELLVLILWRQTAPMTVAQLIAAVDACGFRIQGRASKVVSDQLRYEVARGRVRRVERGVYSAGTVTRQARWRMQRRIRALRTDPPRDGRPDAAGTS